MRPIIYTEVEVLLPFRRGGELLAIGSRHRLPDYEVRPLVVAQRVRTIKQAVAPQIESQPEPQVEATEVEQSQTEVIAPATGTDDAAKTIVPERPSHENRRVRKRG
jgi:hypothetical protein